MPRTYPWPAVCSPISSATYSLRVDETDPTCPRPTSSAHSRLHGQPARDLAAHRARAPWYRRKHTVSIADMLTALRHALLAAQYQQGHPDPHTFDVFPDALLSQLNPAASPETRVAVKLLRIMAEGSFPAAARKER